jgi:hypothetical protein
VVVCCCGSVVTLAGVTKLLDGLLDASQMPQKLAD